MSVQSEEGRERGGRMDEMGREKERERRPMSCPERRAERGELLLETASENECECPLCLKKVPLPKESALA